MAQWTETVVHLECDWCGNPVTFTTGKKVENEDFSNESCVCIECREDVNMVRDRRCSKAEANRQKHRPQPYVGKAPTTQYAPQQAEVRYGVVMGVDQKQESDATVQQDDLAQKAQSLKDELQAIQDTLRRKLEGQQQ